MANGLKPCPFCGKEVACRCDVKELETCSNCDIEDVCPSYKDSEPCMGGTFIICDRTYNGCGAATGWYKTYDEAADAWNKRAGEDE